MQQEQKMFEKLCHMLDAHNWKYKADAEELRITTGARGEDLPMELAISIRPDMEIVQLISPVLLEVQEDKRLDMAIAICDCNYAMVQGCFDYSITEGRIFFRMSNSYADSEISEDLLHEMLMIACITIDEYNDRLLMLNKGIISIQQFLKKGE